MTAGTCRHGEPGSDIHNGELIADEIERWLDRTRVTALSAGESVDAWEEGGSLLARAAEGVRGNCRWGPDRDELRSAQSGCGVAARFLAAAALRDFRKDGHLYHNLMILHDIYSGPVRTAFGANPLLYAAGRYESPANPRIPDLPRLAIGGPAGLSRGTVIAAAGALVGAQRLAALHLEVDSTAPVPPDDMPSYREGFAAAIAATEAIARTSLDDDPADEVISYHAQLLLLRESMAACGGRLAAWAADLEEGELRTQAQAHAAHLIDGESPLPDLSAASSSCMRGIASFFGGLCVEFQGAQGSDSSPGFLVAVSMAAHYGALAFSVEDLPAHAGIDARPFAPRLPDIHARDLMERIDGSDPFLLRVGMESFVHGQGLVSDAIAGIASATAPGELRDALNCAAAHTEVRSSLVAGAAWRALERLAGG